MIEFNIKGYESLLDVINSRYNILTFTEAVNHLNNSYTISNSCILRHDVDYCLKSALCMAKIDKTKGIKSCFYFLVDSEYYNVFSVHSRNIIFEIASMGHEIGIHFDCSSYVLDDHEKVIKEYKNIIEKISHCLVTSISFHCPSLYKNDINKENIYYGLNNTYSKIINDHFIYNSDSLCRFRDTNFFEKIINRKINNLHLLIHPIWWTFEEETRDLKMHKFLEQKYNYYLNEYKNIISISKI